MTDQKDQSVYYVATDVETPERIFFFDLKSAMASKIRYLDGFDKDGNPTGECYMILQDNTYTKDF